MPPPAGGAAVGGAGGRGRRRRPSTPVIRPRVACGQSLQGCAPQTRRTTAKARGSAASPHQKMDRAHIVVTNNGRGLMSSLKGEAVRGDVERCGRRRRGAMVDQSRGGDDVGRGPLAVSLAGLVPDPGGCHVVRGPGVGRTLPPAGEAGDQLCIAGSRSLAAEASAGPVVAFASTQSGARPLVVPRRCPSRRPRR